MPASRARLRGLTTHDAQLHPDDFRTFCDRPLDNFGHVFGAPKDVHDLQLVRGRGEVWQCGDALKLLDLGVDREDIS
ncbi:MAG: hypothetical protein U5J83_01440 [Bryobacterales bacterium]|nr:hypothetical protein [Bryobacterales bacterium]